MPTHVLMQDGYPLELTANDQPTSTFWVPGRVIYSTQSAGLPSGDYTFLATGTGSVTFSGNVQPRTLNLPLPNPSAGVQLRVDASQVCPCQCGCVVSRSLVQLATPAWDLSSLFPEHYTLISFLEHNDPGSQHPAPRPTFRYRTYTIQQEPSPAAMQPQPHLQDVLMLVGPSKLGDPVKGWRLLLPGVNPADTSLSARFHPTFLQRMGQAKLLRTMDW